MRLSEQLEEILESIWIAFENNRSECAKLSEIRNAPNAGMIKELLGKGIVQKCDESGIILTESGLRLARDAVRRHRLAERLLTDVLSVKDSDIHDTACQFEHHLHKGIDTNICILLGHPKVCPHGKPIPAGKCCEEGLKAAPSAVMPLAGLKPGQAGQIAYLYTTDPKQAQMLISMGIVPGVEISLLAGFPSYLIALGAGQFAVDKELAGKIYVRNGG